MPLWNLDDNASFFKFLSFRLPFVLTWGNDDQRRREQIRQEASKVFPKNIPQAQWWAFRIYAEKERGAQEFDVDNIAKLIIDAFCEKRLIADQSRFLKLALYEDDTVSNVGIVQTGGKIVDKKSSTTVEIFGRRQ